MVLHQLQLSLVILLLLLLIASQTTSPGSGTRTASIPLVAHQHVLVSPAAGSVRLRDFRISVGHRKPAKVLRSQILAELPALGFAAHQSDAVALLEGQLVLPGGHVGIKGLHQGTLVAALIVTQSGQLLLDDLVFVACQS